MSQPLAGNVSFLKLCQPWVELPSKRSFQPAAFSSSLSWLGAAHKIENPAASTDKVSQRREERRIRMTVLKLCRSALGNNINTNREGFATRCRRGARSGGGQLRNPKFQNPNPELKNPNPKLQNPNKFQIPNSKIEDAVVIA